MSFEYIAVPAPTKPPRNRAAKTAAERLALAMTDAINQMASEGWEFMRTETLTVIDKAGRFSKTVEKIETVLVFRREPMLDAAAPSLDSEPRFDLRRDENVESARDEVISTSRSDSADDGKASNGINQASKSGNAPSLGGASRD